MQGVHDYGRYVRQNVFKRLNFHHALASEATLIFSCDKPLVALNHSSD